LIASLFAALLFAAPSDSSPSPLGIDFEAGYQVNRGTMRSGWYDLGARVEWDERWMMDAAWSRPSGQSDPELHMVWGKQPEPSRYALRFSLGAKSHWGPVWLAAAGGWAFGRMDTLGTYADPRMILVDDAGGPHEKTEPSTSFNDFGGGGDVPVRQSWVWNNRVYRSAPYAMAEAGIGKGWLALGCRTEYRFGWGIGWFFQIRFRSSGADR
jgi:hypothetical protein